MQKTIAFLKGEIGDFIPEIGIILGSGLGELADEYCDIAVAYDRIPNFIKSTVQGHKGRLVFAKVNKKNIVMMQGRTIFTKVTQCQK